MKWVKYEREGAIVTITMNRPERLNAWGVGTARDLGEAFQRYNEDDEARMAILCGAGRLLCAGGDAKDYRERQAPRSPSADDIADTAHNTARIARVLLTAQSGCLRNRGGRFSMKAFTPSFDSSVW